MKRGGEGGKEVERMEMRKITRRERERERERTRVRNEEEVEGLVVGEDNKREERAEKEDGQKSQDKRERLSWGGEGER